MYACTALHSLKSFSLVAPFIAADQGRLSNLEVGKLLGDTNGIRIIVQAFPNNVDTACSIIERTSAATIVGLWALRSAASALVFVKLEGRADTGGVLVFQVSHGVQKRAADPHTRISPHVVATDRAVFIHFAVVDDTGALVATTTSTTREASLVFPATSSIVNAIETSSGPFSIAETEAITIRVPITKTTLEGVTVATTLGVDYGCHSNQADESESKLEHIFGLITGDGKRHSRQQDGNAKKGSSFVFVPFGPAGSIVL